jgi:5-methylcytosine-specific restriction enzyme subunit McrC
VSKEIVLQEYADTTVSLSPEDVTFLTEELGGRFVVRRQLTGIDFVVNPQQYVGVLTLPSGRRVEIRPKVPVQSVFAMLAVAYDLSPHLFAQTADFTDLDALLEFLIAHFADLLEDRVQHGLYRTYAEREENLLAVRGRIAIGEDLRRNVVMRHRTYCRYTEFTWDVPENQVLRQVAHLVSGWVRRSELRQRLHELDWQLAEITPTHHSRAVLDRFSYHRLNADYEPLHRLCKLFLEGATLTEDAGAFNFRTFLIDMNQLFEAFVTQLLRDQAPPGYTVAAQTTVYLDEERRVQMRPDIVIRWRGVPVLVADCKYKRIEPGEFRHHDVYQVLAYCTALGIKQGALIYPRLVQPTEATVRIRHSSIELSTTTVDLTWEAGVQAGVLKSLNFSSFFPSSQM